MVKRKYHFVLFVMWLDLIYIFDKMKKNYFMDKRIY